MAQNQNISVKVCGNPASNSGFDKLILYNSPSFEIEDRDYVGFDNCSYFYTIRTTNTQTIFKLVKNNVRSFGAIRSGFLVFAFSIPKNYKLDGGYTPYDVLNELKREFLEKCMTLKDPIRETYEFNPGRIDQHVLDEVASKFTVSPQSSPYRVMNPNGPKGYIVENDVKIEELFHDINYPEFDNYSEVIVAESVNQTSYIPINNIQIPRPKTYEIFVDGKPDRNCVNENEVITYYSRKPVEYYDNKTVSFTIQSLKEGDIYEGIELQEDNEMVTVSTAGWATPKCRYIELHIVPADYEKDIFAHPNWIKVTQKKEGNYEAPIQLDKNNAFTLVGEEIGGIAKNAIVFSLDNNCKYNLLSYGIYGNELRCKVELKQESPVVNEREYLRASLDKTNKESILICVKILLDRVDMDGDHLVVKLQERKDDSFKTIASNETIFKKTKKGKYEGLFIFTKELLLRHSYLYLNITDKIHNYQTKNYLSFNKDEAELTDMDFEKSRISQLQSIKKYIFNPLFLVLSIIFGYVIGYTTHDSINSLFTHEQDKTVDTISEERRVWAEKFMEGSDSILNQKELMFSEVEKIYSEYNDSIDLINVLEYERIDTIGQRIIDYYNIVSDVKSGEIEKIRSDVQKYNNKELYINKMHVKCLELIVKDSSTEKMFKEKYGEMYSFTDVYSMLNCTEQSPAIPSPTLPLSQTTPQPSEEKHTCEKCGPDVYFSTQKKLDEHMKSKHNLDANVAR